MHVYTFTYTVNIIFNIRIYKYIIDIHNLQVSFNFSLQSPIESYGANARDDIAIAFFKYPTLPISNPLPHYCIF